MDHRETGCEFMGKIQLVEQGEMVGYYGDGNKTFRLNSTWEIHNLIDYKFFKIFLYRGFVQLVRQVLSVCKFVMQAQKNSIAPCIGFQGVPV